MDNIEARLLLKIRELELEKEMKRLKANETNSRSYHKRKSKFVKFRRQINQIEHDHLVRCLEEFRNQNMEVQQKSD